MEARNRLIQLAKGVTLDIPVGVATITAQFAVVVGCTQPKAHGQQRALTVATQANGNNILVSSPPTVQE